MKRGVRVLAFDVVAKVNNRDAVRMLMNEKDVRMTMYDWEVEFFIIKNVQENIETNRSNFGAVCTMRGLKEVFRQEGFDEVLGNVRRLMSRLDRASVKYDRVYFQGNANNLNIVSQLNISKDAVLESQDCTRTSPDLDFGEVDEGDR